MGRDLRVELGRTRFGRRAKPVVRALIRLARAVALVPRRTLARLSYWRAGLRRERDHVRRRIDGAVPLSGQTTRVALFVSFDRDSLVPDYVQAYLRALRDAGFAIVFISNSPDLPDDAVARLREQCGLLLHRSNVGYDFGAYKDGLAAIAGLESVREVLLVNDSVYGPFRPLSEHLDAGRDLWAEADVWGMTDSLDKARHLQSYFVLFGPAALRHPAFRRFWERLRYVQSKEWVSQHYEVELTRALVRGGLRIEAFCPYRTVAAIVAEQVVDRPAWSRHLPPAERFRHTLAEALTEDVPLNASHFFWWQLIERAAYPFIKRELLQKNPMGLPGLEAWPDVVRRVSDYDTDLIARHLARHPGAPGAPP